MPFIGFPGYPHPWTYRTYFMASFSLSAALIALLFISLLGIDHYLHYRARSRTRSVLYRALSLASTRSEFSEDTPQWMVDLDFAENRRESVRAGARTNAQRCVRMIQYFGVILFLMSCVFMWIVFCLLSFADDTWLYRWLGVLLFWLVLAFCLLYFPALLFFSILRRVLPLSTAFFISLSIMQTSTWDYWPSWVVCIIVTLIMFMGAWPLTYDDKYEHGQQERFHRARLSFRKHKIMFPVVCATLLAFSIGAPIFTAGSCVSFYNELTPGMGFTSIHWSTRVTRSYEEIACPAGKPPCHVYLTVAEDLATSVYVNAHTHPSVHSLNVSYYANNDDNEIDMKSVVMNRFTITGLDTRGDRVIHSILLSNLVPDTTYYFFIQGDPLQRKFRTGPLGIDPYVFASGGDVGNTNAGVKITQKTVSMEPLFMVVGGDLAYSNGLRSCYSCWDKWLHSISTSPSGYTMQILTVTGNHDTGSNSMDGAFDDFYMHSTWTGDNANVPLFFFLFPHHEATDSNTTTSPPPVSHRKPYHAHRVGNSSLFLVVDSGHVVSYQAQSQWMETQLQNFDQSTQGQGLKIVTYHVPFYAFPFGDTQEPGAEQGKPVWTPIFDKYHVQAVFENHVHAFKRTFPLKGDRFNVNGTVYLGDGYWGISPHDELSGMDEGDLTYSINGRIAVGGLKYHVWRGDVSPSKGSLCLTAVGHDVHFDNTTILFNP